MKKTLASFREICDTTKKENRGQNMKKYKDGWHDIYGRRVYMENGVILRGIKTDKNGSALAAWVYRWNRRARVWVKEEHITPAAFRAGIYRGTIDLF